MFAATPRHPATIFEPRSRGSSASMSRPYSNVARAINAKPRSDWDWACRRCIENWRKSRGNFTAEDAESAEKMKKEIEICLSLRNWT